MPSVLVGIAPRMQPYDDSMESLRSAMQLLWLLAARHDGAVSLQGFMGVLGAHHASRARVVPPQICVG